MRLVKLLLCLIPAAMLSATGVSHAEVRGAWVSAWEKGYLTPAEADATIAAAKRAKLNALYIQVRKTGDAYYDSKIEARGTNLAPNYDPLAYVIEKAHAQGIKVHAWVNVCRVWMGKAMPADQGHLVLKHPEWLNRDSAGNARASDGMFIDPGVPEAREYVVSVIRDIAQHYDVDGIHLDYIRYPGKDWGYSATALSRYKAHTGRTAKPAAADAIWSKWRREQVTQLVSEIRTVVKAARPKAQLSAATITWKDCQSTFSENSTYNLVYQDWYRWLSEGLLDANVPMNYRTESSSSGSTQFRAWMNGAKKWGGSRPTYIGIDIYHNDIGGITKQIQAVQRAKMAGFMLFSFNDVPMRESLVAALAGPATSRQAMIDDAEGQP